MRPKHGTGGPGEELCDNVDIALKRIKEHEIATCTNFVVKQTRSKHFGNSEFDLKNGHHKVWWIGTTPYIGLNSKVLDCKYGPDKHTAEKKKLLEAKSQHQDVDHSDGIKSRRMVQSSRKLDCPAQVILLEILVFPQYKVEEDSSVYRKKIASKDLRETLNRDPAKVEYLRKIIIRFPSEEDHRNHTLGPAASIDQRIRQRICDLVHDSSLTNVKDIKRSLHEYVCYELFPDPSERPNKTNPRFYPLEFDVKTIAFSEWRKLCFAKNEQELVSHIIENHLREHPDDFFFFRPASGAAVNETENLSEQKMLLIFQATNQRRLLELYGSICLLDATYRMTEYALPLFFLCVKTNVDYHVVAMFVLQDERTESILEALRRLQEVNPGWTPKCFMTDFCKQEICALETAFPDADVLLCDFHREQAWVQWVNKMNNKVPSDRKNEILCLMRRVAASRDDDELEASVKGLSEHDLWSSNAKLQRWFNHEWLKEQKRWVWKFRRSIFHLNININNGIERQKECLKYAYLKKKKQRSLCSMIQVIIKDYFPDRWRRYEELNIRFSFGSRRYLPNGPAYLMNRPRPFVLHCIDRLAKADAFSSSDVTPSPSSPERVFFVRCANNFIYSVDFGTHSDMPSCECCDFEINNLPCKHFFAVFLHSGKSWDDLPVLYRESPYIKLDMAVKGVDTGQVGGVFSSEVFSDNNCGKQRVEVLPVTEGMLGLDDDDDDDDDDDFQPPCAKKRSAINSTTDPNHNDTSGNNDPLPQPLSISSRSGAVCRDHLDEIKALTYEICDSGILEELQGRLQELVSWLNMTTESDRGLLILASCSNNKKKTKPKHLTAALKNKKLASPPASKKCKASSSRLSFFQPILPVEVEEDNDSRFEAQEVEEEIVMDDLC